MSKVGIFVNILSKLVALLALSAATSAFATTVAGVPTNNDAIVPGGSLQFALIGCSDPLQDSGSGPSATLSYTIPLSSTGYLTGTITGNDDIYCSGVVNTTYYNVTLSSATTGILWTRAYQITGSVWDISTATPISNIPSNTLNIPVMTATLLGIGAPDNQTLTVNSGIISCNEATTAQLGCVKPDGTTILITNGIISSIGGGSGGAIPTGTPNHLLQYNTSTVVGSSSGLTTNTNGDLITSGNLIGFLSRTEGPRTDVTYPAFGNSCANGADPTDTSDSTCAIAAAIAYVSASPQHPGGAAPALYFPHGTYKISSALRIPCWIDVVGDGANASILSETNNLEGVTIDGTISSPLPDTMDCNGMMEGIAFIAPGGHNYIATQLQLINTTGYKLQDIRVAGGGGRGIDLIGNSERMKAWGLEIDTVRWPLIWWANESHIWGLNVANPGTSEDNWCFGPNNCAITSTGAYPNTSYTGSTIASANGNGTVASFYMHNIVGWTNGTSPVNVGHKFVITGTTGTVLDGTYSVTATFNSIISDPSGTCTSGNPCFEVQAASSVSGTATVTSATFQPVISPEHVAAVTLGGTNFKLEGGSIKPLKAIGGIQVHQASGSEISNIFFSGSGLPSLSADITEGGLPIEYPLTSALTLSGSTYIGGINTQWYDAFVNDISDGSLTGEQVYIAAPDYIRGSSAASAFVAGVQKGQYEIATAYFSTDGNIHIPASGRNASGSTAPTNVAWPTGSLVAEHLDISNANVGTLTLKGNHLNGVGAITNAVWYPNCSDSGSNICAEVVAGTIPNGLTTVQYNQRTSGGTVASMRFEGGDWLTAGTEAQGQGYIKCRFGCNIWVAGANGYGSGISYINSLTNATSNLPYVLNVQESDSSYGNMSYINADNGTAVSTGNNASTTLVSDFNDSVLGPNPNNSSYTFGRQFRSSWCNYDTPPSGTLHATSRVCYSGGPANISSSSQLSFEHDIWNGTSWTPVLWDGNDPSNINGDIFTVAGYAQIGGNTNNGTPLSIKSSNVTNTIFAIANTSSGAHNFNLFEAGSANNPGWNGISDITNGIDPLLWFTGSSVGYINIPWMEGYCWGAVSAGGTPAQTPHSCLWQDTGGGISIGNASQGDSSGTLSLTNLILTGQSGDPGSPVNGEVWYNTTLNALRAQINGSPVSLGAGGGGSMVYPGAGVPNSTGTAWGTSYAVGTAANDLVQLDGTGSLPAVSGANLTNIPSYITAVTTTGTNGPASVSGGVLNIPQYTIGSGSTSVLGGVGVGSSVSGNVYTLTTGGLPLAHGDLGLDYTGSTDIGATLNTILSKSTLCSGSTIFNNSASAPNCDPAGMTFEPGIYLITTTINPSGSSWKGFTFDCQGGASNYGNGGNVIFYIKVPAGQDGFWFNPTSAIQGAPQFKGCSFVDGTVYNPISQAFATNRSNVRSLVHFSNVDQFHELDNTFAYAVGNTFNPNSMNGGTLPTSGFGCTVTLDSYLATCQVPSGTSSTTVGYFVQGKFMANDVGGTGRAYQSEIYSASLSGTTLSLIFATPFQHTSHGSNSLYAWQINYGGNAVMIDGFGQLRTTNTNTGGTNNYGGTTDGFSQYGTWYSTYVKCSQTDIDLSGGGAQSYLSGGSTNGTGGGSESVSLYGVSRIAFIGGWLKGSCPNNSNSAAPNGAVENSTGMWIGGYVDTIDFEMALNQYTYGVYIDNGHQNIIEGWLEDTGSVPYNTASTCSLGSQSCTISSVVYPGSTGVMVGGDIPSTTGGSHGANNRITAYVLGFGFGVEVEGTAHYTEDYAQVNGANSTNSIDFEQPNPGDPNCSSSTNCFGITGTTVNAGNIQVHSVVSPPTNGGSCSNYYQVEFGTDGHDYTCTSSGVWLQH